MLNQNQQRASVHKDGPLLLLATAGSGKTSTVTSRYIELVKSGIRENKILMLTFTNKAAKEMKERVQKREPLLECLYISTFHSLCARFMRSLAPNIGLDNKFSIYDNYQQDSILKKIMKDMGIDTKEITPKYVRNSISLNKNKAIVDPSKYTEYGGALDLDDFITIATRYKEDLKKANALDMDDLILSFMFLLQNSEKIREKFQNKWSHIIVDEYQDTNLVQYEIVRLLCGAHGNLCVTGDVNQCLEVNQRIDILSYDGKEKKVKINDLKIGDYVRTLRRGLFSYVPVTNISFSNVNEVLEITTKSGKKNIVTLNHEFFVDPKTRLPSNKYFIFLHYSKSLGFWLSQFKSTIGWDVNRYRRGYKSEKIWIVSSSDSIEKINLEIKHLSLKYNLLILKRKEFAASDTESLSRLMKKESEVRGRFMLKDLGISEDKPISFPLCSNNRDKTELIFNSKEKGFKIRTFGKNIRPLFITCENISSANNVIKKYIKYNPRAFVEQRMVVGGKKHFFPIEAIQIETGCILPIENNGVLKSEQVESAIIKKGKFKVADIEIAETGLVMVDNIVSHNSIYKFRAADYRIILKFMDDFPNAERIDLDINYRSTPEIVSLANKLIENNSQRFDNKAYAHKPSLKDSVTFSNYHDNLYEASDIVEKIKGLRKEEGFDYKDISILCRTNAQMFAFEQVFTANRIPYVLSGGLQFFDRKEIKTMIAYLNLINNPRDFISLNYCINEPKRGLGEKTVEKMVKNAQEIGTTLESYMDKYIDAKEGLGLTPAMFRKAADFYRIILNVDKTKPVKDIIIYLMSAAGLEDSYKAETIKAESDGIERNRLVYISQLLDLCEVISRETNSDSLEDFLSYVSLFSNGDDMHKDNKVKVMTIHASKGLEFPVVFVPGLVEGIIPHYRSGSQDDIEEERRLLYVALTRGKTKLYISTINNTVLYGEVSKAYISRFYKELRN